MPHVNLAAVTGVTLLEQWSAARKGRAGKGARGVGVVLGRFRSHRAGKHAACAKTQARLEAEIGEDRRQITDLSRRVDDLLLAAASRRPAAAQAAVTPPPQLTLAARSATAEGLAVVVDVAGTQNLLVVDSDFDDVTGWEWLTTPRAQKRLAS